MLGDEKLLPLIKPCGEVIECGADLVADVGDEVLIKDDRLTSSPKRIECPLLGWIESRSVRC